RLPPIIFLTAPGRKEENTRRGYALGAADYMSKPLVPEILRTKVSAFVELHRKSTRLARQIQPSIRAEDAIKALNRHPERHPEELNQANRELEAFSPSVSHGLRGAAAARPASPTPSSSTTPASLTRRAGFSSRPWTSRPAACASWWRTC